MPPRTPNQRKRLFPFWVLLVLASAIEFGLLLWIWPTTIVRGWSLRVLVATLATTGLGVYVVGEPIRCRFQISIKVLLAIVTLAGLCCGLFANRMITARERRRCVNEIVQAGGFVKYDFDEGWGTCFKTKDGWLLPKWTRGVLGDEFFGNVSEVWLGNGIVDDDRLRQIDPRSLRVSPELGLDRSPITDKGLAHLATLTQLRCLGLGATRITDEGLRRLSNKDNLEVLYLDGTTISDAGLAHLTNHERLRVVTVRGTNVTDGGVADLQKALPLCYIVR